MTTKLTLGRIRLCRKDLLGRGRGDRGHGDMGTRGLGDVGTWGHGDAGTWGLVSLLGLLVGNYLLKGVHTIIQTIALDIP